MPNYNNTQFTIELHKLNPRQYRIRWKGTEILWDCQRMDGVWYLQAIFYEGAYVLVDRKPLNLELIAGRPIAQALEKLWQQNRTAAVTFSAGELEFLRANIRSGPYQGAEHAKNVLEKIDKAL